MVNLARSIWGDKKRGTELVNPMDFVPQWDGEVIEISERRKQSVEEMKGVLVNIARFSDKKKKE